MKNTNHKIKTRHGFGDILVKIVHNELKRLRRKPKLKLGEQTVANMTVPEFIEAYQSLPKVRKRLKEGKPLNKEKADPPIELPAPVQFHLQAVGDKCGRMASEAWKKRDVGRGTGDIDTDTIKKNLGL